MAKTTKVLVTKVGLNERLTQALNEKNLGQFINLIPAFSGKDSFYKGFFPKSMEVFTSFDDRNRLLDLLLTKINTYKATKKEGEAIEAHVLSFEADCLKLHAQSAINHFSKEPREQIKLAGSEASIKHLELASKWYQVLGNTEGDNAISELVGSIINSFEHNKVEQFKLAKLSLAERLRNLETNNKHIFDAWVSLAKLGAESGIRELEVEGLKCAEKAYNMAYDNIDTYTEVATLPAVGKLLDCMSRVWEHLGDKGKAAELLSQSGKVYAKVATLGNSEALSVASSAGSESQKEFLIRHKGATEQAVLDIKKSLQNDVLNPIQKAASEGKWHDAGYTGDYGVSGYTEESFLKKTLGGAYNAENYKTALKLCFEAINIGIMASPDKSTLLAAIFCQKYPGIISEIISSHPEYFVDGNIFKSVVIDAHKHSFKLFAVPLQTNDGEYNHYFEEDMMKVISSKLSQVPVSSLPYSASTLESIGALIKSGTWNAHSADVLRTYSADVHLKYILGSNLSAAPEVLDIARLVIFKEINSAIKEAESSNFTPLTVFIKANPSILARVIADHSEYFANTLVKQACGEFAKPSGVAEGVVAFSTIDLSVALKGGHFDSVAAKVTEQTGSEAFVELQEHHEVNDVVSTGDILTSDAE